MHVAVEFESFDVLNQLISSLGASKVELFCKLNSGRTEGESQGTNLIMSTRLAALLISVVSWLKSVRALDNFVFFVLLETSSKCSFYLKWLLVVQP